MEKATTAMTNGDRIRGMCLAACAVLAWLLAAPVLAEKQGRLKICKQGESEDWAEPDVWRRGIVVPRGAIFQDVGLVKEPVPIDEWWRLRIETLAAGTIRAREKCITVPAKISAWDEDWGRIHAGKPLIARVRPTDERLFEILRFAYPFERKLMAPWADVVPVEAFVDKPMGR